MQMQASVCAHARERADRNDTEHAACDDQKERGSKALEGCSMHKCRGMYFFRLFAKTSLEQN